MSHDGQKHPVLQATLVTVLRIGKQSSVADNLHLVTIPATFSGSCGAVLLTLDGRVVGLHYAGDENDRSG